MVYMAKVVQCRLVAVILAVAAMTVTSAACYCCWRPVTSLCDVIILLAAGTAILCPCLIYAPTGDYMIISVSAFGTQTL